MKVTDAAGCQKTVFQTAIFMQAVLKMHIVVILFKYLYEKLF